jgi:hypothetical protein
MRRLLGLVLPALLALLLLAVPAAASAAADAEDAELLLAADADDGEVEEDEDPEDVDVGPDPQPRGEDNPATELGGYGDLDTPFTWGAAFIMLFLGMVGAVTMGGLYWLLVHRPRQKA